MPADPSVGSSTRTGRRRWLIGGTIAWAVFLVAVGVVSYWRGPATVPDQVDIAAALPELDRAAVAVLTAADAPDRALVIGELRLDRDCDITPVRPGAEAIRDVTVHVRAGAAPAALDAIAAALPTAYQATVSHARGGRRHALAADAGDFVAVHGTVEDTGTALTLRMSTGCRPLDAGVTVPTPSLGAAAKPFAAALEALGLTGGAAVTAREMPCPSGGPARTVQANGTPAPADLSRALSQAAVTATVIESSAERYAYRLGGTSIVVTAADNRATVSATTGCN